MVTFNRLWAQLLTDLERIKPNQYRYNMSDFSSLSSIMKWEGPKLTGSDNFAEWKQYIEAVSVSMDIYYLVEQEEVPHTTAVSRRRVIVTPPSPTAPAATTTINASTASTSGTPAQALANVNETARLEAAALHNKHQRRFWGLLFNSLHINIVKQLSADARNPSTFDAIKLWRELHQKFDKVQGMKAITLLGKLTSARMKTDGNMENHLNSMRELYTSLTVSGQEISDKFFASLILNSLPQDQYGILSGVIARDSNLSSEDVCAEMTAEWERMGMPGKDDKPGDESALDEHGLYARTDKSKNVSSKTRRPQRKYHCTEHPSANSHDTKDCNVLKKKAKSGKSKSDDDDDDIGAIASIDFGEEDYEDIFGMVAEDAETKVLAMGLVSQSQDETTYVVDSGATKHIVCTDQHLVDLVPIKDGHGITVGGGHRIFATHRGTLIIGDFKLDNVLCAPEMGFNLLSVHKFSELGYKTHFENGICVIFDKDDSEILRIQGNGLYKSKASHDSASLVAHDHSADQLLYLHRSLGISTGLTWLG
jgi:hypothetical protein